MKNSDNFFKELENKGVNVTASQKDAIEAKMNELLTYEPRIGVFGKTGVGKSSLCNALFGRDVCPVSDIESCTRNPQEVFLGIADKGIKLLDVPGVGESSTRDKEYAQLYSKLLPELDVVLWLVKSDDRAFSSDEVFFNTLVKHHIQDGKPFFFVINQIDKISPEDWDREHNEPSAEQYKNIERKIAAVAQVFQYPSSKILAVSANKKFNLISLVDEIVFALPRDKKITFFREVSDENKSQIAYEEVKRSFSEAVEDTVYSITGNKAVAKIAGGVAEIIEDVGKIVKRVFSGCFIATATCQHLNKPDNCYELNAFRNFRDNWLIRQSDGEKLITEYYCVAPKIVEEIDKLPDRNDIYSNIYTDNLSKCLSLIESGNLIECKAKYTSMVNALKERFIHEQ